ncbi:TPA: TldD/PmbA family protein [Pseudomonas putida]|jgi:predicted Zn-dependent protease|uniref:TldD/PmbA family protein n=1 Tax=Pseudomonas TaxID=286 RepID=UPI00048186A4|nr:MULTISPECIES: TldD/PmbA family protein [Pseudomonas]MDD2152045.1 TldD/PmbA family protein [Pseudomonas putida]RAS26897.1 putative Zn-dependent protease [Pseudomonas sp. URMO17WK12:I7]SMF23526.1 Predicted Zn-dependent protease or its inactivated homolog [Pseudomonas sp. URMO17WK12:I5]HDS1679578.1 TldD/PmbA family protein [Pseudomonas putida]
MKHLFQTLVAAVQDALQPGEQFTLGFSAEQSQFVRFNHAKVRQAGEVSQASAQLRLIRDGRQAEQQVTLSGDAQLDLQRLSAALEQLRQTLPLLAIDPYLRLDDSAWHNLSQQDQPLPELDQVLGLLDREAGDLDLVGIYAAGPICRGFASSFGAFGWHQANSFNFDWSLFHSNGQAVKANYAGQQWSADDFTARLRQAREQLGFLGRPAVTLKPGSYRAYLAPAAMDEIAGMLCWGGFSAQALATGNSALQRLYNGDAQLHPLVSFSEQVSGSLSPAFSDEGSPRLDVPLIQQGKALQRLVSARSAAEFELLANGADSYESPCALSLAPGSLPSEQVLERLGTGLYISNLWYLNYSDLPAARMTGLTRFATFWVENGEIQGPVSTMRFDDSLYSLLGSQLEDLTQEREMILSTSTYGQRSTGSSHLPGALVKGLTLTL